MASISASAFPMRDSGRCAISLWTIFRASVLRMSSLDKISAIGILLEARSDPLGLAGTAWTGTRFVGWRREDCKRGFGVGRVDWVFPRATLLRD